MLAARSKFRAAVIAVTIVAMLSVSSCAWFRSSLKSDGIAFIATVYAATYIITMQRALMNQAVSPEDVVIYRVFYAHRTLELVTAALMINLLLSHFNQHRVLWWPLPIYLVILHSIPGIDRFVRDHDRQVR
jgi:hypothetical protein